jgi:hypothetical protein
LPETPELFNSPQNYMKIEVFPSARDKNQYRYRRAYCLPYGGQAIYLQKRQKPADNAKPCRCIKN